MTRVEATPEVEGAVRRRKRRVNAKLMIGAGVLGTMLVLALVSAIFYDIRNARALSAPPELPPMWVEGGSSAHPLGTESLGRDLLALTIAGVPTSLWVGFLAASISTGTAIILGFWAGLRGGLVDDVIRSLSDAAVTIPTFAVLVVFASFMENLSVTNMAILLSIFGWAWPTRTIRSQVLTMRERGYVKMARLDGRSSPAIMFGEIMPNLLPYLAASFIGSVSGSILAATSLEALGLGPTRIPSLGNTLDSALDASAILRGLYWWWGPPVVVLIVIFLSLFLIAVGLDEIVNPRLVKKKAKLGTIEPPREGALAAVGLTLRGEPGSAHEDRNHVLAVSDLHIHYELDQRVVKAVNGVSLAVGQGEALGLVGESGCGKSTVAMSTLALISSPGRVVRGEVLVNGADVTRLEGSELRSVRWSQVSLIPQGAMNSLNPVMRVGAQVAEVLVTHERMPRRAVKARVDELFGLVGLPQRAVSVYPHELSGGMKQRASIAMAVALNPDLIVADEPTSALDVVTQRLVVQTLIDVKERFGSSLLMAGHDIALLAQVADRLAVMRDGVVVEMGETGELLENPLHPYTQLLITSVPVLHAEPAGPASATEAAPDVADAAILSAAEDELAMAEPDVVEHPLREVTPGHFAALPDSDV